MLSRTDLCWSVSLTAGRCVHQSAQAAHAELVRANNRHALKAHVRFAAPCISNPAVRTTEPKGATGKIALSQGMNYFVHPKEKQTGLPGEAALGTKTSATVALCVAGTVCRRWRLATPRCSNCAGGQLERRHAWEPRTGGSRIHTGGGSVLHAWLNAVCQAATLKHGGPFQVLRAQVRSLLDQPLFSRRSLRA